VFVVLLIVASAGTVAAADYEEGQYLDSDGANQFYQDNPEGLYLDTRDECVPSGLFDFGAALNSVTIKCKIVRDATITDQSTANFLNDQVSTRLDNGVTELNNLEDETEQTAYGIAQTEYAKAVANGTSKIDAKSQAQDAVEEYIVKRVHNQIVSEMNSRMVEIKGVGEAPGTTLRTYPAETKISHRTVNATIAPNWGNNSKKVKLEVFKDDSYYQNPVESRAILNIDVPSSEETEFVGYEVVYSDNGLSNEQISLPNGAWNSALANMTQLRNDLIGEISTFSSNLDQSQYEDLNASDILGPTERATRWGQEYNDTGSSGFAAALMAQAGYSTAGNISTKYAINYTDTDTIDYTGVIYGTASAWDATNGSVETNYVYDGANQTAFLVPDSRDEEVQLNQDYEVESITLQSGKTVNSTDMISRQTTEYLNASAFGDNLRGYQELLNQTEQIEDDDCGILCFGGGGGGPPDFAQGGGPDAGVLDDALDAAPDVLRSLQEA